jgi:hypothetical protein
VAALAVTTWLGSAAADDSRVFKARLDGFTEVPSVSSTGEGTFRARVDRDRTSIDFDLTYENLEGAVTAAAHIHLGERHTNGGVSAFLCGGGGKPACPAESARIRGTIVADDVIGPGAQGIDAGELDELIDAMRAGATYVNVHTDKHPGGEIRGIIRDD